MSTVNTTFSDLGNDYRLNYHFCMSIFEVRTDSYQATPTHSVKSQTKQDSNVLMHCINDREWVQFETKRKPKLDQGRNYSE